MTSKTAAADRSQGGPGSSRQNASKPVQPAGDGPEPGQPTNPRRSRVSGGGGERDSRHSHDPRDKS
jgi:hypothetical protein